MLYLVAIVLPPVAILMTGAWFQAIINLILFVVSIVLALMTFGTLWMICVGWALFVVYRHYDEQRLRRVADEARRGL